MLLGVALILNFTNCKSAPEKEAASEEPVIAGTCAEGDCKAGTGTMEFKESEDKVSRYAGSFKDGRYDGEGTFTFSNGDVYKGQFVEDRFNGKGSYTFAESGDVYEGDFKDDKFDGVGKYTSKLGNSYEGDFKEGKFNGQGKLMQADGDNYEGGFKDDLPSGKGVLKDKDGKVIYEGEFMNGLPYKVEAGS